MRTTRIDARENAQNTRSPTPQPVAEMGSSIISTMAAMFAYAWVTVPQRTTLHMCRNIKTLFNFEPPATEDEIRDASLQFVRKLSGSTRPSKVNEAVFERAVDDVAAAVSTLLGSLSTSAAPKNRDAEAEKAKARAVERFGGQSVSRPAQA
jgi:hypothetical protein